VVSQVPSYNYFALLVLMYHRFQASTLHGVIMISLVPSCIYPVWVSKGMPSSIALKIDSVWKFLPQWRMSSLTLELENILSHFEYLTQVTGPRRWSNEARHNQCHEAQSDSTRCYVTHVRKEKCHGRPRSFPPYKRLAVLLAM
jgi:hypothetical protein